MKLDDMKTAESFEVIKPKALQFPIDFIEVKPSVRSNFSPDTFDTSVSSLYAFRFFSTPTSSEAVKTRLSKSRAKIQTSNSNKERSDQQLSPVELTIKKKIKYPYDKKRTFEREKPEPVELTLSDRQIIKELRHHLRTQPFHHNGTTSVLEAIGDPQVRDQRTYYEPLKTFLQGKDTTENKIFSDSSLPVADIMIPGFDKELPPDSRFILPLTVSRHHAAVSRNANRLRNGASVTLLPKVVGSSMIGSHVTTENLLRFNDPDLTFSSREPHIVAKSRTQFVLPRIGLKRYDDNFEKITSSPKKKAVAKDDNQSRNKTLTVQLPNTFHDNSFNGFPRRVTTTATGKAHLIGPMNKMDIITDYSKALECGLISYNEYLKKLSILSLHKVPIGNSMQRHFHIIRDEANNLKPRLTHVDVNAKINTNNSSVSSDKSDSDKIQRPAVILAKAQLQRNHAGITKKKATTEINNSSSIPQVHRIDIGEGLALLEKPKHEHDVTADAIVPDLMRYVHVHHPRQGRLIQYHWNHESAFPGSAMDMWSNRHWQSSTTPKISNKIPSSSRNSVLQNEGIEKKQSQKKVLLSMEEYLQMHSSNNAKDTQKNNNKQSTNLLGGGKLDEILFKGNEEDGVQLAEENFDYVGKLPEPVNDSESMALGAREILRSVNFKLPAQALPRKEIEYEEPCDVDSVFQEHLHNMLRTIKKAKINQNQKVPELRGLAPSAIPQVLLEAANQQKSSGQNQTLGNYVGASDADFLGVYKNIPVNSPPPSARKRAKHLETQALNQGENEAANGIFTTATRVTIVAPAHANLVTDKLSSQTTRVKNPSTPKTPMSVQRNRSSKLSQPNVNGDLSANNNEVRIMTASVDLILPSNPGDNEPGGASTDRSRLEVVITSVPIAPPTSVATTDESDSEVHLNKTD